MRELNEKLAEQWHKSGVCEGDIIMVHSSLRRLFKNYLDTGELLSPQVVLESFVRAVGSQGTLLFPLFNYDFTKGIPFDMRHTPSQVGILSETARHHPQAVRTKHPIFSFAVIGAQAENICSVDNFSGWGTDSPFALLREMDGKIALLDCLNATMIHHAEEMSEVPYRYHKNFTGEYTDVDGETSERTYSFFARDIEKGVLSYLQPIKNLLDNSGILSFNSADKDKMLKVGSARQVFEFVTDIIVSGAAENIFYRIEGKKYWNR